jgi:acyl-CoA thioester hydrolase
MTNALPSVEEAMRRMPTLDFSDLTVRPDWCDRFGFMRPGYVTVLVDRAMTRVARDVWGVGWDHIEPAGQSGFVLGIKVTHFRSLCDGDPVGFEFIMLDADDKRTHVLTTLRHRTEGWMAATQEQLNICVDFANRRAAPWAPPVRARLQGFVAAQRDVPRPRHIGFPVGDQNKVAA